MLLLHVRQLNWLARAFEVNLPVFKSVDELTLAIKTHTLRDLKLRLKVEVLLIMLQREIEIMSDAFQNIQAPSSTSV